MNGTTRIAVLAATVGISLAGLALGGVFSGAEQPQLTAKDFAPAQGVAGVTDPNAALRKLLEGFSTGDTAAFAATLEENVANDPMDADSLTLLGLTYQQRARETGDAGFLTLAERALRHAQRVRPNGPLLATGLATLAIARHRFADAVEQARLAIRQNAEDATAYGALGDALLSLGRYQEAFEAFDHMVLLSPGVASYSRIAYARELLGRPTAALETLHDAFDLALTVPEHVAATYVALGNLEFNTGNLGAAERAYRHALAVVPGYLYGDAGLARVDAARGDFETAITRLRHVVDVMPLPQHVILLGDVLSAAGREPEAREAYTLVDAIEQLLEANGVRTELQTALFDLDHDRDVAGALERARLAYDAAPGITAADTLAWALFKNGRCGEALTHSQEALRLGTLDALMLFHRGMIERCLGNDAAAVDFVRRALSVNPHFSLLYAREAEELVA